MTSTQPQIARSSDGATSLVFSVEGRVVEHSSSRWRPEVFVAGIYLGCRVILLNAISARFLTASCMHGHFIQQRRSEGENISCSRTSVSLSGNYFRNRCKPTVAVAGCGWLCCMPSGLRSFFSIGYAVNMTWIGDTYALYWNCRNDRLSSTAGHEPQISMHTDYMLIVGRLGD